MDNKDCYSFDGERYQSGDLDEAVEELLGQYDYIPLVGEEFTIFMGISKTPMLEDVVTCDWIVDNTIDYVFDNYGDVAADCFSSTFDKELEKSLVKHLEDAVKQWRINNNFSVNFFEVNDIEEVRVLITDEQGNYEVINEH